MAKAVSTSSVKVVRRIGVLSVAKLYGVMGAVFGLIMGFFIGLMSTIGAAMEGDPLAALGWIAIIVVPIVYGIGMFLMGAVGAWLYNLFASKIGGVEITLE